MMKSKHTQPKQKQRTEAGFTLVEMLVYIAILVAVSIASIILILKLSELFDLYRADQLVTKNAQTALERILYEIRDAELVDTFDPSLTLNTSPGHLVLDNGSETVEFYLSSTTLMVMVDGVEEGPLTSNDVTVDALTFNHYENTRTEAVQVQITVTASTGRSTSTESFSTAAVLMGSYD